MPKVQFDITNLEDLESYVLNMVRETGFLGFIREGNKIDKTIAFTAMVPRMMIDSAEKTIMDGEFTQLKQPGVNGLLPIEMTLEKAFDLSRRSQSSTTLKGQTKEDQALINKRYEEQAVITRFMTAVIEGATSDVIQALKQAGSLDSIESSPNEFDRKHIKISRGADLIEHLNELKKAQASNPANINVRAIEIFRDFLKHNVTLLGAIEVNLAHNPSAIAAPVVPTKEESTQKLKSTKSFGLFKTLSFARMTAGTTTLAEDVKAKTEALPTLPLAQDTITLAQIKEVKEASDQFILAVVELITKDPVYVLGLIPSRFKQFSDFLTSKFLSEEIAGFEVDLKEQGLESNKSEKLAGLISSLDTVLQASKKLENTVDEAVNELLRKGLSGPPKKVATIIVKGITENRAGSSSESATVSRDSQDSEVVKEATRRREHRRGSIARIAADHAVKHKLR